MISCEATSKNMRIISSHTCNTDAPACKNCNETSAESTPPIPRMVKPGNLFPIAVIARKAIGLVAFPDTPPYVVRFSVPTAGHGVPSGFKDINPETVLMAETPSALPIAMHHNNMHENFSEKNLIKFRTFVGGFSDRHNVSNIWGEFHEEWNFHGITNPQ